MTLTLRTPLLALGLTLALSACGKSAPLTEQEQHTVTELTTNMKTRCLGRYLIDLPADVQTSGSATLEGVQVSTEKMTQQAFLKEMEAREKELRAVKHPLGYQFFYSDPGYYITKSQAESIEKEGVRYFIHLRNEADPGDTSRTIEVYKWDKGYRLQLQIDGSDFRNSIFRDRPSVQKMKEKNDVDYKFFHTLELARAFQGRPDDDIPSGPGVCFDGGFIAGAASDEERINTIFYLTGRRDVSFNFSTDSSYAEETTLSQRSDQINAAVKAQKGTTIRTGMVELAGISQADEWLGAIMTTSHVSGHRFRLEANSKIGSTKTPLMILEMDNGVFPKDIPETERTKASLTEGEAVALWDAVSRTIRVRPGAMDAMPVPKVDTRLPLGMLTRSGQLCRQPGHCRAHWNGKTYRATLYPNNPAPMLKVMEPVPYRWLPGFINNMLLRNERLPMVLVEHAVDWELTSYFL